MFVYQDAFVFFLGGLGNWKEIDDGGLELGIFSARREV